MSRINQAVATPLMGFLFAALLAFPLGCAGADADIHPGKGAAGVSLDDTQETVEQALGPPEKTEGTTPSSPASKEAVYFIYPSKGIDVLLEDKKVRTVFLYQAEMEGHQKYPGHTSEGLSFESSRDDVVARMGEPTSRGLAKTADLWFRYESGIEFTFTPEGSLRTMVITRAW